jgi:hypothetical protein
VTALFVTRTVIIGAPCTHSCLQQCIHQHYPRRHPWLSVPEHLHSRYLILLCTLTVHMTLTLLLLLLHTNRALPRPSDALRPPAFAAALAVLTAAAPGRERTAALALLAADMLLTSEQACAMLEHLVVVLGVPALSAVHQLWGCVVDSENQFAWLCSCVQAEERRELANLVTHERFKFSW